MVRPATLPFDDNGTAGIGFTPTFLCEPLKDENTVVTVHRIGYNDYVRTVRLDVDHGANVRIMFAIDVKSLTRKRRFRLIILVMIAVCGIANIDHALYNYDGTFDSGVDISSVGADGRHQSTRTKQFGDSSQVESKDGSSINTRVLLGITNVLPAISKYERRRRHLIRHTYLQYYGDKRRRSELMPSTKHNRTMCSLQEFQRWFESSNSTEFDPRDCQLVYTFVFGTNPKNNKPLLQVARGQDDVLLLNRSSQSVKDMTIPWIQYASETITSIERNDDNVIKFDFIAKATTQHVIYPDEFIKSPNLGTSTRILFYSKLECKQFIMVSPDLAHFVLSKKDEDVSYQEADPEGWIETISRRHPSGIIQPSLSEWQGVSTEASETTVYDFLALWDQYEISRTTYDDPHEVALVHASKANVISFKDTTDHNNNRPVARLLLGIFTTNSDIERQRRHAIRSTYLKYYSSNYIIQQQQHRICSFLDIVQKKVREEDCQVAYAFVVGANEAGPTELVDFDPSVTSMTVNPTQLRHKFNQTVVEDDVVYLNIRENMVEGKSQTWFKYAVTMLDEFYFDYVGKTDTDTVLFVGDYLSSPKTTKGGLSSFPTFPDNIRIYGGVYVQPTANFDFPAFMHGKFYLLSPDLARFIVSPSCNRSALMYTSECIAISNFVHSHPMPIQRWRIPSHFWAHPVKDVNKFRQVYKSWLSNRTTQ